jgi:hypothetical protein
MFLLYVGIGIAAHSFSILILTLPLAVAIRYGVVAREEAHLGRRFGDIYPITKLACAVGCSRRARGITEGTAVKEFLLQRRG